MRTGDLSAKIATPTLQERFGRTDRPCPAPALSAGAHSHIPQSTGFPPSESLHLPSKASFDPFVRDPYIHLYLFWTLHTTIHREPTRHRQVCSLMGSSEHDLPWLVLARVEASGNSQLALHAHAGRLYGLQESNRKSTPSLPPYQSLSSNNHYNHQPHNL